MSGLSAVFLSFRRTPLAFGLCLLAFLFAVEAKTAWYGPLVGPGSDVLAAKALPANLPKVVEHGVPVPDPVHPRIALTALLAIAAARLPGTLVQAAGEIVRNYPPVFPAAYFSPPNFFRPPPIL